MARHVTPRHKMVSSGRLTGSGRGQMTRKKVAGRPLHLDPSYSLYSTDSEDQVTTINKGLDRCAALLSDILQAEKTESKTKSQSTKAAPSKKKTSLGKNEAERKRVGKKANAVTRINKRPAPVQKTILPPQTYAGLRGQPCVRGVQQPPALDVVIGSEVKPGGTSVTQVECVQPHSFPLGSSLPSTGPQPSTVFNCRLTTSTPALSPHRPTSAHSQAPHRGADGETHHFTQQWAGASAAPSNQHGVLSATVSPTQYTASFSVAPAVQLQPAVSTVSAVQPGQLKPFSPVINAPHAGSGGQGSALLSHSGPQSCPSPPASAQTPTPVPLPTHILLCDSSQDQQLSSGECVSSSSEESGDCMSEEDELDRVDTMPVRDTSCQTSVDKHTVMLKHKSKSGSPEKTARKVMTVKYLLGELKALVANQDSEAVRLISEVEQSISLLPAMVGSTNIQAELALALQPLRSENVQLRRRLRILNQQLQERERAERQARPVDCNLELVSLQSLNLTLQTQLNDLQRELENLQQENQKLRQAVEDRENDLQQTKEQCELETSRIRKDVSEALAEMRNCQAKLEDSEREKTALTHSLQQKEAEITKLQEIIRNLQKSSIPCHPAQTDVSRPPAAQLTKSVLDQYENQQREPSVANQVTDSVKAYLQTLEDSGHSSPPHPAHPQPHKLSRSFPGQWKHRQESSPKSSDVHTLLKNTTVGSVSQEVEQSETAFIPLRETARGQPAPVPQKHSPVQGNDHVGLKYLGLAFNKLGISNGLPALDDDRCTDYLPRPDGVNSQLKQPSEGAVNPAEQSQSQHARRRLHMGEASVYTGRPSAHENSFSSCDIKSLASDWSVNSWSTFNTRDEQEFRNGLAALDASIASLQRTLKADLKR
ncbi:coiled-coil domain-containing protein 14 [Pangasianodon hypophthalmus]|uniref:coiled-coil domain-containing protein 14 n=1 Tax=Pangasianodon hypophthalmus TaxID=310915 RepID=UPI002308164E|nr:coiled-coil domain-containing protein 14 [Pangasianodon hypophthalmus]